MILYIVTHRETGKAYVGITTVPIEKRWYRHKWLASSGSNLHFHNALRKYSAEAFDWEVVERYTNYSELLESEIFIISYLRAMGAKLYNLTLGGEGSLGVKGWKHSDEARAKMSRAGKGRPKSPEHIAKVAATLKNRGPVGNETKAKLRLAWIKRKSAD